MKIKVSIILAMLLFIVVGPAKAQDLGKNEVHVGYSDGFTLAVLNSFGDVFSTALIDGLTGENTKLKDDSSFGMIEVGYKYQIKERLKLGIDVGYQKYSNTSITEKTSRLVKRDANFILIMPNLSFSYIKTTLLDFYGSLGAGVLLSNDKVTLSTTSKSEKESNLNFGWQVVPVGLRVGKKLGGFLEAGIGTKGFVTAGLNYKF